MSATCRVAICVWSRTRSACRSDLLKLGIVQEAAQARGDLGLDVGELDPEVLAAGLADGAPRHANGRGVLAERELHLHLLSHAQRGRGLHQHAVQAEVEGQARLRPPRAGGVGVDAEGYGAARL